MSIFSKIGSAAKKAIGSSISNTIGKTVSNAIGGSFGNFAGKALNAIDKTIGSTFENPFGIGDIPKNTYKSYSSRCKIKFYHYKKINPDPDDTDVTDSSTITLDSDTDSGNAILSYSFTKSLSGCAGYFQISLAPTNNWLQKIKPGDWLCVYLSNGNDGKEHLRCMGIIDVITMSERHVGPSGARSYSYSVSGRDFGKVFEKYMIYINYFVTTGAGQEEFLIQDVLGNLEGSPDSNVKKLLEVFLEGSGGQAFESQSQLNQWYIPSGLAKDFGAGGDSKFYDILNKDTIQSDLPGYKLVSNVDVRTPLWTLMQGNANLDINELFVELHDSGGKTVPSIFLRTIPFSFKGFSTSNGNIDGALNYFLDLPTVEIKGDSIINSDTRLHDHDRFTFMVYLTDAYDSSNSSVLPSVALLENRFPFINGASCRRNGLSVYERSGDYLLVQGGSQFVVDNDLLVGFNELLKHWYKDNAFMEDANMTIMGNGGIRVGKRLNITSSPLLAGNVGLSKSYYIEAYVENWEYGSSWTQQLVLTRGVFVSGGSEGYTYNVYGNEQSFNGTTNLTR